jgi:hypothetical protein
MQVPGKRWMNLMEIIWEVKLKGVSKLAEDMLVFYSLRKCRCFDRFSTCTLVEINNTRRRRRNAPLFETGNGISLKGHIAAM